MESISNKDQVVELLIKCKQMKHDEKDGNTLLNQLSNIAFNDTVYRCFNEGLRIDKGNNDRPLLLIDQFHDYFFKNQVINIRRIFDKSEDSISLRRIFDLIYRNKEQITRGKYLNANKTKTDEMKDPRIKEMQIEYLNKQYDIVSNKRTTERKENDKLYYPYLESMLAYLKKRSILHEYTDSYVAHSLNKYKRKLTIQELNKISLMRLQKSYKEISWLAYTISRYIGECILFEVPIVSYNQFDGWVGSLFKKNIESQLYKYWDKRCALFKSWQQKYWFSDIMYIKPYTRAY